MFRHDNLLKIMWTTVILLIWAPIAWGLTYWLFLTFGFTILAISITAASFTVLNIFMYELWRHMTGLND